ncbi:hypothetical protein M3Y94_00271100 [Aphelenchoides besseyi]|nr:hypothetical protein M3Y94_00271100 [Aphelenchoides besseyi]KAI6236081.1 hypothetical protein M3Y95_00119700 [Aphelenchoides besseyi]
MGWTNEEKAFCVLEFAKSMSPITVQRAFRRHFKLRYRAPVPAASNFPRWLEKFLEQGNFARKQGERKRTARTTDTVAEVLRLIRENPNRSVRSLASLEGMPSRSTIHRILTENR